MTRPCLYTFLCCTVITEGLWWIHSSSKDSYSLCSLQQLSPDLNWNAAARKKKKRRKIIPYIIILSLCSKYWHFCVTKINTFTRDSKENNSIFHVNINVHFTVQTFNLSYSQYATKQLKQQVVMHEFYGYWKLVRTLHCIVWNKIVTIYQTMDLVTLFLEAHPS